jgi:hypothetical protein
VSPPEAITDDDGSYLTNGGTGAGTWHGIPRTLGRYDAVRLLAALDALWEVQTPAKLRSDDQEALSLWFDPLARGQRLRAALDALPAAADIVLREDRETLSRYEDTAFLLNTGEGRLLVTPEGRALMYMLKRVLIDDLANDGAPGGESSRPPSNGAENGETTVAAGPQSGLVNLPWEAIDEADAALLRRYREWALQRLTSVVNLRTGQGAPMLPQAVGLVLLLLLNGNVGSARALPRPERDADRRAVDAAVAAVTSAFVDALVPRTSRRTPTAGAYSLYGGYALTEARRRFGADLATNPVYIAVDAVDRVLDRLGLELARRDDLDVERIAGAIDLFGTAYREHRSMLAAYGLAKGRPGAAADLRRALVDRVREVRRNGVDPSHPEGRVGRAGDETARS